MRRLFAGGFALLVAVTATAGQDKKDAPPALSGAWTREAAGHDLTFEFKDKTTLTLTAAAGDNAVTVTCSYTVDKTGVVKAKVTGTKETGNFPAKPAKGFEFGFKWKVKGDVATLDDLTG